MRVLVTSNPGAARARRGMVALREALPEDGHVTHRVTGSPEELAALVGHDRWRSDDLLVINGGDGSVQHALTALLAHCPVERQPHFACLPGGTTNMTAFDLNGHRRFDQCVETLRRAASATGNVPPAPRSAVRVHPRGAGGPRCGLFFGVGTIVQGIEYFQARIRHRGGGHELGAGAAMVRALWGIARGQPPFAEPLRVRVDAPALLPAAEDGTVPTVSARLLLATTLDRLFLGIRPYWGRGPGALKTTLVESNARRFVTRIPRLLRGRPDGTMSPRLGYHSARLDALALAFCGAQSAGTDVRGANAHTVYTLDGELFRHGNDTIDVHATEPVNFLPL